jgi:cold shock CspA family protein
MGDQRQGRIKWFNIQHGYGFITPLTAVDGAEDIFVHHTSIITKREQYKYLVEGEYVEFVLEESSSDKHPFHATAITGIQGGPLLCETRNLELTQSYSRHSERRPDPRSVSRSDSRPDSRSNSRSVSDRDGFEFPKQKHRVAKN